MRLGGHVRRGRLAPHSGTARRTRRVCHRCPASMHLARHARGAGKRTSRCRDDEPSPAGVSLRATLREPASPRCWQNGPTYNAGRPPLEEPLWAAPPTAGPSPPARMLPARVASTLSGAGGCRPELCPGGQGCCACLAYAQQTKAGATRQRWQVSEAATRGRRTCTSMRSAARGGMLDACARHERLAAAHAGACTCGTGCAAEHAGASHVPARQARWETGQAKAAGRQCAVC